MSAVVFVFCGASMSSLMSPPSSSHVAGAVSRFHGTPRVFAGLLPSAGSLWEASEWRSCSASLQTAQDVESLDVVLSRDQGLLNFSWLGNMAMNVMLCVGPLLLQAFRVGQCSLGWMRTAMIGACVFSCVSDGLRSSFPGFGSALRAAMLAAILMLL